MMDLLGVGMPSSPPGQCPDVGVRARPGAGLDVAEMNHQAERLIGAHCVDEALEGCDLLVALWQVADHRDSDPFALPVLVAWTLIVRRVRRSAGRTEDHNDGGDRRNDRAEALPPLVAHAGLRWSEGSGA